MAMSSDSAHLMVWKMGRDLARRGPVQLRVAAKPGQTKLVRIDGELSDAAESRIRRDIDAKADASTLCVLINSNGGLLRVGQRIAADLEQLGRGATVEAHVARDALCASAAVYPFAAAEWRTCDVGAKFMLHRAAYPDETSSRFTAGKLRHLADKLDLVEAGEISLVQRRLKLSADEARAFMAGEDVTLDAARAFQTGLVNHVRLSAAWPHAVRV